MSSAARQVAALALVFAFLPAAAPAAVSPTAVVVPLPLPCDVGPASTARHLSRDASGRLWVAANCTGQVVVTSSADGGATWGSAVAVLPQTVVQVAIAGGTLPGHALVSWQGFLGDLVVRTTSDAGASWSPATTLMTLATASSGMSLVAEGNKYHVMVFSATRNEVLVRTSPDRGATWSPEVALSMPWAYGDLLHDAASDALELVADSPSFFRRTSTDHGASFGPTQALPGGCCLNYSDWALGGGRILYGVGNQPVAWRIDLAAAAASPIAGLADALPSQRSLAADDAANAFVATREQVTGLTVLQRIAAGAPAADPPLVLDLLGDNPNVVACDAGAAAVLWRGGDQAIWFDKSCADGSWSCCEGDANSAPDCRPGGPYVAECAGAATVVALDGTASTDPDLDAMSFAWSTDCPGAAFDDAASPTPLLVLDASGCDVTCTVTLSVSDGALSSACAADLRVLDTTAPALAAAADIVACLWPPSHRLVELSTADVAPALRDACDPAPSWTFVTCVSDQPDDATGDGETEGDCVVARDGLSVLVRSERDGARPEGRTYELRGVATDGCGNASAATVVGRVRVPHDGRDHEECLRP